MREIKSIHTIDQPIKKVQLSIASSEKILGWSKGEVTKPETINYKTHVPEKKGLFDETIFGPVKDYKCANCAKVHKRADAGKLCPSCGESTIESKLVRRRHMGHITLGAPVTHIWFSKVDYSAIKSILGLKQEELDSIIYFRSHIVYDNAGFTTIKDRQIIPVQTAPSMYKKILTTLYKNTTKKDVKELIQTKIDKLIIDASSDIGQNYGIDFYEYNNFISKFSDIRIGTGAEVLQIILKKLDLKKEQARVKALMAKKHNDNSLFRRNKVIESFILSKQDPSHMILTVLPVIPADLRPLIQLDGGRHSTVDINELYRRVIIRNNRLKQWNQIGAPDLIVQNEKRMLQESVDALFDNERKPAPVLSKDGRQLKSLSENLKGKQGRFRQNLLGKRVDYSGRSVIVVGPSLKLHQVGLPKQMVVKLFEPFIVQLLVEEEIARNIKQAKKMIELYDDRIWKYADRVIKNHPVLLNRAPSLHRLSIQAFFPVITPGKAIRLHPLVTPAFNADFDGDQMAVHVPLSEAAKIEAKELILSTKNILGPKDGKLIVAPSQDIILGLYFLTKSRPTDLLRVISSNEELDRLMIMNDVHIHDTVVVPLTMFAEKFEADIKAGKKYLITTLGRLLLNRSLPANFIYVNDIDEKSLKAVPAKFLIENSSDLEKSFKEINGTFMPLKKSSVSLLIETVFERNEDQIPEVLDFIKELGFKYSMMSGVSMSISDIIEPKDKEEILTRGDLKAKEFRDAADEGLITDDQRYLGVLGIWSDAKDEIKDELADVLNSQKDNPLFMMMDSGARGNISNFVQLAGLRGSMAKATHEYAALKRQGILVRSVEEIPIKSSFKSGLTPSEYFLSTHGARKGLSDTATKTAESGYLTRRLVDAVQDIMISEEDCGTNKGVTVEAILDTKTKSTIESLQARITGRHASHDIKVGNKIYAKRGELIDGNTAEAIHEAGIDKVSIRSVLTCNSRGICAKCFGRDLTTGKPVNVGEAVGIISAQSIGEPGTQLTMRTFHTGGVAGVADITQGFSRLMELVDANSNPKGQAVISEITGKIHAIEDHAENKLGQITQVKVTVKNSKELKEYIVNSKDRLRIKEGDEIYAGGKITEGVIKLQTLLEVAGPRATQSYLIKEMQRLYRLQGIEINDKYMEVIIRQMLSKFQIIEPGDADYYISQVVSMNQLRETNRKLIEEGKTPAYGKQIILGVKPLPIQSESFLAAASYQRTAEAILNAAISMKHDNLYGVKESLIVGNRIPVGTGMANPSGKYDIFSELNEVIRLQNEKLIRESGQSEVMSEVIADGEEFAEAQLIEDDK